ncbi:hypothetical protein BDF20DRAFT_837577 [Mycotypha africana]|uniref:uncharacterized protein n=1 Tax=Mycotypha africana TaxID=64632 RepID=UPI0023008F66|nr:uncharacterized protein BDF20DRAFT_837577 [Mycotypha africana]KAI8973655.1 hypothetical protein BDF20DRAFT_837577 [Mycotypha africana]
MPKVGLIRRVCSTCKFKCIALNTMLAHYASKPLHCKSFRIKRELEKFILINHHQFRKRKCRCAHRNRDMSLSPSLSTITEDYYGDSESMASRVFNESTACSNDESDSLSVNDEHSIIQQQQQDDDMTVDRDSSTTSVGDLYIEEHFDKVVTIDTSSFQLNAILVDSDTSMSVDHDENSNNSDNISVLANSKDSHPSSNTSTDSSTGTTTNDQEQINTEVL